MAANTLPLEQANTTPTQALLEALTSPFEPAEVSWVVVQSKTNSQGKKVGLVTPYAVPRAYTDRLNQVVTPAGWTRSFSVTAVAPLIRQKKEHGQTVAVQTGKIVVTCTITIPSLGEHSSTGESWADDDNAMTSAEAQAFKRACTCFGLGRYFYDIKSVWVELDTYNKPVKAPVLPSGPLPKRSGPSPVPSTSPAATSAQNGPEGQQRPQSSTSRAATGPTQVTQAVSERLDHWIKGYESRMGSQLYSDVAAMVRKDVESGHLSGEQARERAIQQMERTEQGLQKISALAEQVGEQAFSEVFREFKVPSLLEFPNLRMLVAVFNRLTELAALRPSVNQQAA